MEMERLPASVADRFERYHPRRRASSDAVKPRALASCVMRVLALIVKMLSYNDNYINVRESALGLTARHDAQDFGHRRQPFPDFCDPVATQTAHALLDRRIANGRG